MSESEHSCEFTRLWNEWLKTDDGKGYEAGWGDYQTQLHSARGRTWVMARIIAGLRSELAASENYVADREVDPTCVWFKNGRKVRLCTETRDGRIVRAWLDVGGAAVVELAEAEANSLEPTGD